MGLNAEIITIGSFRKDIINLLEYPSEIYEGINEGAPIIQTCIYIISGSSESRKLVSCFFIEPWNFNQHELDISKFDKELISDFFEDHEMLKLQEAGFKFYYKTNG